MTDQIDLDRLAELASNATPGPWEHDEIYVWCSKVNSIFEEHSVADSTPRDAPFIAALDPDTVRALIAMARRAEEAISGAQWVDEQLRRSAGHVSNAEARVKAAESERDEAVHHAEIALGRVAAANEKLEQVRALAAANNRLRDSENACMVYAPSILAIIDQTKEGK